MSQVGEFCQREGQNSDWREISATREIRYRASRSLLVLLALLMILIIALVSYIVVDKLHESRELANTKVAEENETIETLTNVSMSGRGVALETQYGKMFLLKSGELYYLPNSGVTFAADALPGEAGRYVIEKGDIDNFDFPASVVDGLMVTTSYVFDGYRILSDQKVDAVRELENNDVVGSRSFLVATEERKNYLVTITLGNVQRTLVYDEVEEIIYPETTEVKTEKVPVGVDSEEAKEAAEAELEEAQAKVTEPVKVIKRIPKIETSLGEARAQVLEL